MAFYVMNRVRIADQKTAAATNEGRILRRQSQKDALDIASAAGTLLYGPVIDDSIRHSTEYCRNMSEIFPIFHWN